MKMPNKGQKTIPLDQWRRFTRVADWWDRTFGQRPPAAGASQAGECLIVKTPIGGIPARSGKTLYSAQCIVCAEADTETSGQKQIVETASRILVYNVYCMAVPGKEYVPTALTEDRTRYAVDWDDCESSESTPSDSSSSDSGSSSDSSDSGSESSDSLPSASSDDIGDCTEVPTCTWWGRVYESGYAWLAYPDLTMPQCNGISPFPSINCGCAEPDRAPAYDYEIVYTPCNKLA